MRHSLLSFPFILFITIILVTKATAAVSNAVCSEFVARPAKKNDYHFMRGPRYQVSRLEACASRAQGNQKSCHLATAGHVLAEGTFNTSTTGLSDSDLDSLYATIRSSLGYMFTGQPFTRKACTSANDAEVVYFKPGQTGYVAYSPYVRCEEGHFAKCRAVPGDPAFVRSGQPIQVCGLASPSRILGTALGEKYGTYYFYEVNGSRTSGPNPALKEGCVKERGNSAADVRVSMTLLSLITLGSILVSFLSRWISGR